MKIKSFQPFFTFTAETVGSAATSTVSVVVTFQDRFKRSSFHIFCFFWKRVRRSRLADCALTRLKIFRAVLGSAAASCWTTFPLTDG